MSPNNRYKLENNSDLETINSFKILISNIKALKDKLGAAHGRKYSLMYH